MATGAAALERLCDPHSEVSAHYVVEEDGRIFQLVHEAYRAWHAGKSYWADETDMNAVSIGIEIVNGGHDFGLPAYPDAQIEAVIALCRDIARRRGILPENILAHSDIAPDRKTDPGELFPGRSSRRPASAAMCRRIRSRRDAGLGPGDKGAEVWDLQRKLVAYGYGLEVTGVLRRQDRESGNGFPAPFPSGARRRQGRSLDARDATGSFIDRAAKLKPKPQKKEVVN